MSDKELIQALRCCGSDGYHCGVCPCFNECEPDCGNRAPAIAADRLEALLAENEWLKTALEAKVAEMPEGKPGDYLELDCGTGWTDIYFIHSVNIYPGGEMRYDLGKFVPIVNHPNIIRIMSRDEAEKELKRRC